MDLALLLCAYTISFPVRFHTTQPCFYQIETIVCSLPNFLRCSGGGIPSSVHCLGFLCVLTGWRAHTHHIPTSPPDHARFHSSPVCCWRVPVWTSNLSFLLVPHALLLYSLLLSPKLLWLFRQGRNSLKFLKSKIIIFL